MATPQELEKLRKAQELAGGQDELGRAITDRGLRTEFKEEFGGQEEAPTEAPTDTGFFGEGEAVGTSVTGGEIKAPIKGQDFVVDIEEDKKGTIPEVDFSEESVQGAIVRQRTNKATDADKELIAKFQTKQAFNRAKGLDAFGNKIIADTVTTDGAGTEDQTQKIADIKAGTRGAIEAKQEEIDLRLTQAKTDIQNRGAERKTTLDRGLSFSGFGRSSTAIQKRDELQQSINQEISIAEQKASAEAQLFKAQAEGAEAETISAIQKNISDATANLKKIEAENARDLAKMNQELGLKAEEALNSLLEGTSQGLEAKDKGFDKNASLALGYVSDSFGNPLIQGEDGEAIPFEANELGSEVKISNFKDGNDNTYVYKNGQLDSIIQRDGTILTGDEVKTTKVPAEVLADKTNKQKLELEGTLRKQFGDDPLIKKFTDIKGNFQRVQAGVNANSAAGDIALVFSFMKMLDPGSVVREGEFATAQNATGVPEQIRNQWNKLKTGEFLDKEQKKDFEARAKDIFDNETENASSVRDFYKKIAEDSGVRTEFITGAFDDLSAVQSTFKLGEDEETELDSIFGGRTGTETEGKTTPNQFQSKSGKTFNINFNGADQTAGKKDTASFIKEQEGFSPQAFSDFKQNTSGFGTKALPGETSITEEEANKRLQTKITQVDDKINKVFGTNLTEGQKTALTSFMFNLGVNIFDKPESQVLKNAILKGDGNKIKEQFVLFNKAGGKELAGLTNRRKRELEQYFNNS